MSDRIINVDKKELIKKIKENKKNHITEFAKAITAYKKEAEKQLQANLKRISKKGNKDDLSLRTSLIVPVDRTEDYDKLLTQFDWELEDILKENLEKLKKRYPQGFTEKDASRNGTKIDWNEK